MIGNSEKSSQFPDSVSSGQICPWGPHGPLVLLVAPPLKRGPLGDLGVLNPSEFEPIWAHCLRPKRDCWTAHFCPVFWNEFSELQTSPPGMPKRPLTDVFFHQFLVPFESFSQINQSHMVPDPICLIVCLHEYQGLLSYMIYTLSWAIHIKIVARKLTRSTWNKCVSSQVNSQSIFCSFLFVCIGHRYDCIVGPWCICFCVFLMKQSICRLNWKFS